MIYISAPIIILEVAEMNHDTLETFKCAPASLEVGSGNILKTTEND